MQKVEAQKHKSSNWLYVGFSSFVWKGSAGFYAFGGAYRAYEDFLLMRVLVSRSAGKKLGQQDHRDNRLRRIEVSNSLDDLVEEVSQSCSRVA